MELQLPFLRRILAENPAAELDIWNLARNKSDAAYVDSIAGDRITVRTDFFVHAHRLGWNKVYKFYDHPSYVDTVFVKLDDDVVFLETPRFPTFIDAILAHPDHVISANVINNGACTPLTPGLWENYEKLRIKLLDVHKSNQFAVNSHTYFFQHHHELLDQPVTLVPTKDWISINAVGYTYTTAQKLAAIVGKVPHPPLIAGRRFPAPWGLGDEGAVNMCPRIIMGGFTACHLTFGPQEPTPEQLLHWRTEYADIAEDYLLEAPAGAAEPLPELSELSWKYRNSQDPSEAAQNRDLADWAIRSGWHHGENDPSAGRYRD